MQEHAQDLLSERTSAMSDASSIDNAASENGNADLQSHEGRGAESSNASADTVHEDGVSTASCPHGKQSAPGLGDQAGMSGDSGEDCATSQQHDTGKARNSGEGAVDEASGAPQVSGIVQLQ